jgi:hypothetical protein
LIEEISEIKKQLAEKGNILNSIELEIKKDEK